jgi:hypothetical protein
MDSVCRECVSAMDCSGGRICQADHSCGACTKDEQCSFAGGACEHGMCPAASDVAWVDCAAMCPGDGSLGMPFCRLSEAVNGERPYVVMTPRTCFYDSGQIRDHTQEIDGRGATLLVQGMESGIFVTGDQADAFVHDLFVTSQTTTSVNGAMVASDGHLRLENVTVYGMPGNASQGILAQSGNLVMRKCLVYGNAGWGVEITDSHYQIENSFVLTNGSQANTSPAGCGGVRIMGNSGGTFIYNTVARNTFGTPGGLANGAGVKCERALGAVVLINSLLIDNAGLDSLGVCDTSQGTLTSMDAMPEGPNDIFMDPGRPDQCTMRNKGFHVKTTATKIVHQASAQTSPSDDFDGDQRPVMTTPGADEPLP